MSRPSPTAPDPKAPYREEAADAGEIPGRLPHPVVFVQPDLERWSDLAEADPPPLPGEVHARFTRGADAWTLLTYLVLKRRGQPVSLSPRMVAGAICVAHHDNLELRSMPYDSYIVAIRADRDPAWVSHWQIAQSPTLASGRRSHYLPYWPQPGLQGRDPARGARVERIGFMGQERNLAEPFRSERFRERLAALGMHLVMRTERHEWHDYRDLDAILAVREGNPRWLMTKPASKLVNAWLAGCPALLGEEPAYRSLRRSDLDYLSVGTPDEAIAALGRLQGGDLHPRMAENGRERGADFTVPAVARRWESFLSDEVSRSFERWQGGLSALRPVRIGRFAWRLLLHRTAPRRYRR